MANDLDFAQFGESPGVVATRCAKQLCGVNCGHVERRQLVGALARRGLLEEQRFVLGLVRADLAESAGAAGVLDIFALVASSPLRLHRLRRQDLCCRVDLFALDDFCRAPERAIGKLGVPAAQVDAADNLVFEQPPAPR